MGAIVTSAGPLRIAVALAAALVLVLAACAGLLGVAAGFDTCTGGDHAGPSAAADRDIPENYLTAYRAAGREFDVSWQVLAAIGAIETDHGRLDAPGVRSGLNSHGCCAGPMQFNLTDGPPSTWQRYGVDGNHDDAKDVYDPDDAIHSAGSYLRALLRDAEGDIRQAIFGYNHSLAYVNDVIVRAHIYAGDVAAATDSCASGIDAPAGPADVRAARRLTAPRAFKTLPTWAMAPGHGPEAVDARIYADVIWILRRYHLRVTAAREPGHRTHGDGTAIDLVPADGITQAVWDASAGQLVHDLGWTPGCGSSGTRPSCPLVPAIQFIGYDGYPQPRLAANLQRRLPRPHPHLLGLPLLRHKRPLHTVPIGDGLRGHAVRRCVIDPAAAHRQRSAGHP
jgi:transglycosylase-like protein with SLT domain